MTKRGRTIRLASWQRGLAALVLLAVVAAPLRAQNPTSFFRRQQFLDETTRRQMDANVPAEQRVLLEYGGYFVPQWQQYDDLRNQSNVRQLDLRLWGQLVFDDVHRVYARMRLVHTNFGPGDSPFSWNQDLEGPNLDQGFYELALSKAAEKYWGQTWPWDVRLTMGRQFVEFGHGVTLSKVLDGLTVVAESGDWRLTGLLGNTIRSETNIDRSPPVSDHMDRLFAGVQAEYLGLSGHQPFVYYVRQNDNTDEEPVGVAQDFRYDSSYVGFGSSGEIVQDLRYATEVVFEFGRGTDPLPGGRNDIRAFAFDQLFEYYLRGPHEPVISVEYALATGDDDRTIATDTIGGNGRGNDNAFLGFGYVNTGYALAAEFTNLQFLRIGGRFRPLPDRELFKDLEVGLDFYFFWKQKDGGPISDFRANPGGSDLGHEVDLYANWRILSDLSVMLRYARFWTGDAFADGEIRDYAYAGLVYSF